MIILDTLFYESYNLGEFCNHGKSEVMQQFCSVDIYEVIIYKKYKLMITHASCSSSNGVWRKHLAKKDGTLLVYM